MLDLREGFLCRVEVRRVGRQVDELAAPRLDQLPYPLGPVCPEGVGPKIQNYLSYVSTPSWAMAPERCASSGCSHSRTFGKWQAGHRRARALVTCHRV